jgi:hypothetical protein
MAGQQGRQVLCAELPGLSCWPADTLGLLWCPPADVAAAAAAAAEAAARQPLRAPGRLFGRLGCGGGMGQPPPPLSRDGGPGATAVAAHAA